MKAIIKTQFPSEGIRDWLFRHLFPDEYDHMRHLVDDVIDLEIEKRKLSQELAGWQVSHNFKDAEIGVVTTTSEGNETVYVEL